MWKAFLCRVFGHVPLEQTIFSALCERCDTTIYYGPVKEQGEAWGRRKYEDRNPKYAVSE